ncbi:hypothetical protein [Castellaniella ginsengisoli]|uniref:Uncharacterized protein n=1 Tax=Castellaniella ginsengisoli TaxID=546114 RepID=A0AB39D685_9BURK
MAIKIHKVPDHNRLITMDQCKEEIEFWEKKVATADRLGWDCHEVWANYLQKAEDQLIKINYHVIKQSTANIPIKAKRRHRPL